MGHAEDWDCPKPTIVFGLGAALGKEEVMSKVDLGDEQEADWEQSGAKSKQAPRLY